MFNELKLLSITNAYLFCLRFVGVEYIVFLNHIFLCVFLLGVLIHIFFAYSKYYMVIENKKFFVALGESAKIALLNFGTTFKIYVLILLLNIRVILNFLLFLFIPLCVGLALSFITVQIFQWLAISIIALLFLLLVFFTGYVSGVVELFTKSLWYHAYKEGKNIKDQIKSE